MGSKQIQAHKKRKEKYWFKPLAQRHSESWPLKASPGSLLAATLGPGDAPEEGSSLLFPPQTAWRAQCLRPLFPLLPPPPPWVVSSSLTFGPRLPHFCLSRLHLDV